MENNIIVICGFSSSGKDTISKYLFKHHGYSMVISHTSRPMRPNESERNPYFFISKGQFENMIDNNEFIECRKYNTLVNGIPETWYYGLHKNCINLSRHTYVVVLDLLGLIELKKYYKDNIISFFIDVDEPTRKKRAIDRDGFDETEWNRRYEDDKNKFPEDMIAKDVDYIVENYDFGKCVDEIINKIGET
jgi:guanylate kinase